MPSEVFFLQMLICYMPFLAVRGNQLLNHSIHQQGMQSSVHFFFFVCKVSLCDSHYFYLSTLECCEELQARITVVVQAVLPTKGPLLIQMCNQKLQSWRSHVMRPAWLVGGQEMSLMVQGFLGRWTKPKGIGESNNKWKINTKLRLNHSLASSETQKGPGPSWR